MTFALAVQSPVPLMHLRIAKENPRYMHPRVACGRRGKGRPKWEHTLEMREAAVVDCPHCMLVKDLWLMQSVRRPFTVRRARELLKAHGVEATP